MGCKVISLFVLELRELPYRFFRQQLLHGVVLLPKRSFIRELVNAAVALSTHRRGFVYAPSAFREPAWRSRSEIFYLAFGNLARLTSKCQSPEMCISGIGKVTVTMVTVSLVNRRREIGPISRREVANWKYVPDGAESVA